MSVEMGYIGVGSAIQSTYVGQLLLFEYYHPQMGGCMLVDAQTVSFNLFLYFVTV